MKVPDTFAPYLTADTVAVIQLHELPDQVSRGKLSRVSPVIREADRIRPVKADRHSGTRDEYRQFVRQRLTGRGRAALDHAERAPGWNRVLNRAHSAGAARRARGAWRPDRSADT